MKRGGAFWLLGREKPRAEAAVAKIVEFLVGLEKMRDVCALDPEGISVSLTSRACLSLAEVRGAAGTVRTN